VVDAFKQHFQVEKHIVFSVRHILDDLHIVPLEKVALQLQPIEFLIVSHRGFHPFNDSSSA
jgi:hypothetical protein